jgi:ribosomal protein S3
VIGVKCWIYQGENIPRRTRREENKPEAAVAVG